MDVYFATELRNPLPNVESALLFFGNCFNGCGAAFGTYIPATGGLNIIAGFDGAANLQFTKVIAPVPLPATLPMAVFGLGLLVLTAAFKRRRPIAKACPV